MSANDVLHVTMFGPHGVGKSSMLAAMLESLERSPVLSGVRFEPDEAARAMLTEQRDALRRSFALHAGKEVFPAGDAFVTEEDALSETCRFAFRSGTLGRTRFQVEFTDVHSCALDRAAGEVIAQVQRSAVVIVAIDAVALMERSDHGVSWHEAVNEPRAIHTLLMNAGLSAEQSSPQLVLFVPLRCEKYFHQPGGMERLTQEVRRVYAPTLAFLDQPCYTVAVTPILTMGDVVFRRFDPRAAHYAPLYALRDQDGSGAPHTPAYAPRFAEQPLCWMAAFLLQLERYQKEMKKQKQSVLWRVTKEAAWLWAFGLMGLMVRKLPGALQDAGVRRMMDGLRGQLKTSGDGYALIQDHLGLCDDSVPMRRLAAEVQ